MIQASPAKCVGVNYSAPTCCIINVMASDGGHTLYTWGQRFLPLQAKNRAVTRCFAAQIQVIISRDTLTQIIFIIFVTGIISLQ